MRTPKKRHQYFLSVEGHNEKWYFEHLRKLINASDEINFAVNFDIKIEKSPKSRMKAIKIPVFGNQKIEVFHIADYESNEDVHQEQFIKMLDELKEINTRNSNYQFYLGYSNLAFELWLLLHKNYNFTQMLHRKHYIDPINRAYGTDFARMKENKHKEPFDKLLAQIDLNDVKMAIKNAEKIRPESQRNGNKIHEHKGFRYFKENPDLTINKCIERIFSDCMII